MPKRARQVSFVKEVYHSSADEEDPGNWYAVPSSNTTETILEDESEKTPETWEKIILALETKCEIDSDQLQFKNKLKDACGSIGEVWKAQLWHIDVIVKKLKLCNEHSPPSNILPPTLAQEVTLLKSLRHPNCVLFIGYTNPPSFSVVTEYMSRGNIRDILKFKNSTHFAGSQFFAVALSVARGMNYLHTLSTPIVHGNLSSYNILCQDNWEIKISDYGMKLMMDPKCSEYGGRIPWRAPEVELGDFPTDPSADVYSFGIVLWEIVTSEQPYASWNDKKQLFRAVQRGLRPKIPPSCSPEFRELMEKCWDSNPKKRPTFHEIIEKLKPYEKISMNMSKQLFPDYSSIDDFATSIKNTQKCTELFSLRERQSLSLSWTFYVEKSAKANAMKIINQDILSSEYSNASDGELVLSDTRGKITWMTNFKERESLQKHCAIKPRADSLHQLSQLCVTPVMMEIKMLLKYSLRTKPTHALVISVKLNNEFRNNSLQIFEEFVVPYLSEDISWCGSLLMIERSSGYNSIIALYADEIRLDRIIRSGFIHSQINHFKRYLIDIPIITKETVEQFTFFKARKAPRERSCSDDSPTSKKDSKETKPRDIRRVSTPFPARLEVKPKPSKPLQLEDTENPLSARELLYLHPFSASNNPQSSASCREFGVVPKGIEEVLPGEEQSLGQWQVIIVEPVRGGIDKKKIKLYYTQRKMEPMVLLLVSLTKITYFPCGAWSRVQGVTTVTQSRARTIPLSKVTKITQLTLPNNVFLLVLETSLSKNFVIFGFAGNTASEFVTILQNKTFQISFVNHNILSL